MSYQIAENNNNFQKNEDWSFLYRESIKNHALLQSEKEESVLDIFPAGVIKLNHQGYIQYANDMAKELLGDSLYGTRWVDIIQAQFDPRVDDGHEVSLKNGQRLRIETRPLLQETGQLVVLFDLTESRVLQEEISNLKKLSEMGKMVSSLAHQIRNPLATALMVSNRLKRKMNPASDEWTMVHKLEHQLSHIENQIKSMLIYAKKEIYINKKVNLVDVIDDAFEMMNEKVVKHFGHLSQQIKISAYEIQGNHDVLVGALVNLIQNSLEAVSQRTPEIEIGLEEINDRIYLYVQDNGCGFKSQYLQKAMEPFFTTKESGTGLGLSVVLFVAHKHGATVNISNRSPFGARIEFEFKKQ
jgi:two-component system, sensor histidine kinase FlrB